MCFQLPSPSSTIFLVALLISPAQVAGQSVLAIEQIGDRAAISITQLGLENTLLLRNGSDAGGASNDLAANLTQVGTGNVMLLIAAGGAHASTLSVLQEGNGNSILLNNAGAGAFNLSATQTGDLKSLSIGASASASVASIQALQFGSGAHHAEISLLSPGHTVTLEQGGEGSHSAQIALSGNSRSVDVRQGGAVARSISINDSCTLSCSSPIVVNQR